jgi:hypothetical protein
LIVVVAIRPLDVAIVAGSVPSLSLLSSPVIIARWATRRRRRDTSIMTFLMFSSKCALLPRWEGAVTVGWKRSTTMRKIGGLGKGGESCWRGRQRRSLWEGRKPGVFMNPRVFPTCIAFWPGEKELNLYT